MTPVIDPDQTSGTRNHALLQHSAFYHTPTAEAWQLAARNKHPARSLVRSLVRAQCLEPRPTNVQQNHMYIIIGDCAVAVQRPLPLHTSTLTCPTREPEPDVSPEERMNAVGAKRTMTSDKPSSTDVGTGCQRWPHAWRPSPGVAPPQRSVNVCRRRDWLDMLPTPPTGDPWRHGRGWAQVGGI